MNPLPHRRTVHPRLAPSTTLAVGLATALAAGAVHAQSVGHADDFSRDSLRYSAETDIDGGGNGTTELTDDGVRLRVDAPVDGEDYLSLSVAAPGDTFGARVTMESIAGDVGSQSGIWLEALMYNAQADFGGEALDGTGDVYAAVTLDFGGDGGRAANLCLAVQTSDGSENFPGFGEEGNSCETFADFLPDIGIEYAVGIVLDREAGALVASAGDAMRVVPITTSIFAASRDRRDVQLVQSGKGVAAATVHGMSSDGFADDFRVEPPVLGPYQISDDATGQEGTVTVVDGRARLDVASDENGYRQASLRFTRGRLPDYLETRIAGSSESTLPADGRIGVRLQGRLYNDTAEGGFNDREGDVYAAVELTFRGNGGRSAEYCLARNDNADGEAATPLLDNGNDCLSFGLLPELDTAYEARLVLDREAGTVTFALDDEVRVHDIATPIFPVGNGYREVMAYADGDSVAVAFADDLRTAADAMTAEEIAAANAPVEGADPIATGDATTGTGNELTDAGMPVGTADAPTTSTGSGGSGGGCSIGSTGDRDPLLALLALLALVPLVRRRGRA